MWRASLVANMEEDWELRLTLSKSDSNKLWVNITSGDGTEKQVGFNVNDCNQILQVNEYYYDDLTDEERADPMIAEARATLALACFYPDQFAKDPEFNEVITYIDGPPSEFISKKHTEDVFKENFNIAAETEGWAIYDDLLPSDKAKPQQASKSAGDAKAKSNADEEERSYSDEDSYSDERSYSDSGSYSYSDSQSDSGYDSD